MNVSIEREAQAARVTVAGSLNTNTARQLEHELAPLFGEVETIVFDLAELDYISSAGLRVLMMAFKRLGGRGVTIENAGEDIREVLDITGFSTLFDVR